MKKHNLHVYNSYTRQKEFFEPIKPPFVGMYVCGPTVYGDPHLGHARPYITFDVLFRYLKYLGHKVRYVRNITDVGHLVNDADEGEDKIAKKAKVEQLEPMEVVQQYTNSFHDAMRALNNTPPSIEPSAAGHIPEQIKMVEEILEAGLAYESNGSVYFDVEKYAKTNDYGKLSGKVLEDLIAGSDRDDTRSLDGQQEKRSPLDFAIWKNALPEHIMRWESPWGLGFPGWHMECSVMSRKYLDYPFDIHGGGMDLQFPHHECEIAQAQAATGQNPVKYWMHNNMITLDGKKMGKSYGNGINLDQFFSGDHTLLEQAYTPMTIRFYILMAHYRSTLDFSNDALKSAHKAYQRLMNSLDLLENIKPGKESGWNLAEWEKDSFAKLDDDLNTAQLLANLFDGVKIINQLNDGKIQLNETDLTRFKELMNAFVYDILGLINEEKVAQGSDSVDGLMQLLIDIRNNAKVNKDWATADKIRDQITALGYKILDGKDGSRWEKI
jgi:cysteinyl-tRNA synthetase